MKKLFVAVLSLSLCTAGFSQSKCTSKQSELPSTSSTAMSAMIWGLGLVVGIAVACVIVKQSKA